MLLGSCPRLDAQTSPVRSEIPDINKTVEPTVTKLSPFVVSTDKDTGYIAADTLNAGLLNTKLLIS